MWQEGNQDRRLLLHMTETLRIALGDKKLSFEDHPKRNVPCWRKCPELGRRRRNPSPEGSPANNCDWLSNPHRWHLHHTRNQIAEKVLPRKKHQADKCMVVHQGTNPIRNCSLHCHKCRRHLNRWPHNYNSPQELQNSHIRKWAPDHCTPRRRRRRPSNRRHHHRCHRHLNQHCNPHHKHPKRPADCHYNRSRLQADNHTHKWLPPLHKYHTRRDTHTGHCHSPLRRYSYTRIRPDSPRRLHNSPSALRSHHQLLQTQSPSRLQLLLHHLKYHIPREPKSHLWRRFQARSNHHRFHK